MFDCASTLQLEKYLRCRDVRRTRVDSQARPIEEYVFPPGDYLIGRFSGCDICLADPSVSRVHACLVFDAFRLRVLDFASSNGTLLDGQRIKSSERLLEGTLSVGNCKLLVFTVEADRSGCTESTRLRVTVFHSETHSDHECSRHNRKKIADCLASSVSSADAVDASADTSLQTVDASDSTPNKGSGHEGEISLSDPLRELTVGIRVEFLLSREPGVKRLLRLKSIGKQARIFFFHSHQKSEYTLSLTAKKLSQYLQDGTAKIVRC